jgi:hypothetical protein
MMWGWIPFTLWLFSRFKHRHAVIAGFALSWMFLPQYKYALTGLPNYTKVGDELQHPVGDPDFQQ